MTYDVGTHIDLSHMNKKAEVAAPKNTFAKSFENEVRQSYDAGTQLVFKYINGHFVTARKIHVAIA